MRYCVCSGVRERAAEQGVAYVTARRWYAAGTLPVPACRVGGLILIGAPVTGSKDAGGTVVCARVSSAGRRADLSCQMARVTGWASGRHLSVDEVVSEAGSASGGHRRTFLALLGDEGVSRVVVARRIRLARFGGGWVQAAMSASTW
jgi:predicted site-specific integrase-resolvase